MIGKKTIICLQKEAFCTDQAVCGCLSRIRYRTLVQICAKYTGISLTPGSSDTSYTKIQDTVVGGYKKVEDAFVGKFLTHEGGTVEEAKARMRQQEK